jgi:hypothetical protein
MRLRWITGGHGAENKDLKWSPKCSIIGTPRKKGDHFDVKYSRGEIQRKVHTLPRLRFGDEELTSFSGLVVIQALWDRLGIRERLRGCFRPFQGAAIYGFERIVEVLVLHFVLGYRELRDVRYYREDPLVQRVLGLRHVPDVATISRRLAEMDAPRVGRFRWENRDFVLEGLSELDLPRVTLDLDGSVQLTRRYAEGTAVGYKCRRGARSYYPLFCTVAQTGQVLDVLHRQGAVHDSNGAREFMGECVGVVRGELPGVLIEARMDSAFFDERMVDLLDAAGVEFTISVPFERLPELRGVIQDRRRWRRCTRQTRFFEMRWKPKSWGARYRFLCIRKTTRMRRKGPVQLDLFEPYQEGYEFKVIVTNKKGRAKSVAAFHEGRGCQEGIFGELRTACCMDYVPTHTRAGNETYLLCGILAHNLIRRMQMIARAPDRNTNWGRAPMWVFEKMETFCRKIIQRAGRLTTPGGQLTLTLPPDQAVKKELLSYLSALEEAA